MKKPILAVLCLALAGFVGLSSQHGGKPADNPAAPVEAAQVAEHPPSSATGRFSMSDDEALRRVQLHQLKLDRQRELRLEKQRASRALERRERAVSASVCGAGDWRRAVTSDEAYIIAREHGATSIAALKDDVVMHDYNPTPTSTGHAFGMGQLTDENRERFGAKLGVDSYTVDPCAQLAMMRMYISERYGSAANAVAFWQNNNWY